VPTTLLPIRVGDIEVLVETVELYGSEPTSALSAAQNRVSNAFDRAKEAIIQVAGSAISTIRASAEQAGRPEKVELEFGLKFDVNGNIVLATGSAGASLTVKLSYQLESSAAVSGK